MGRNETCRKPPVNALSGLRNDFGWRAINTIGKPFLHSVNGLLNEFGCQPASRSQTASHLLGGLRKEFIAREC
jgi:hypothetical protein